jgi:hypothetical protein
MLLSACTNIFHAGAVEQRKMGVKDLSMGHHAVTHPFFQIARIVEMQKFLKTIQR